MEWNMKTPSHWDWDNLMIFNGRESEGHKQVQPTDWGIEGEGGIDNGSFYSSVGGGCSGSDMGKASSSKSSISASVDSSSKGGINKSDFNFQGQDLGKNKELGRADDSGTSPALGASLGSVEPLIGLKLGKRTYFEDVCGGSTVKPTSFSQPLMSSTAAAKRSRAPYQSSEISRCQVEGCNLDLTSAKDYHRRHRVCESHSKCPRVVVAGQERRFCQQCSRFHDLTEFDDKKRSCRRRLSDHNARRRKPQPEAIHFNSGRLSSSFYDAREQASLLFNRIPLVHTRSAAKPTWETSFSFKSEAKEPVMMSAKGGTNGQLYLPNNNMPNTISTIPRGSDRALPFKYSNSEVLSQGLEAPVENLSLDATPDFRRALSLLSNNPLRSGNRETTSFDQLMHTTNHTSMVQAAPQGWPLGSSEYWQAEHQSDDSQVHSFASQINAGNQFQEFQLFKAPFESGYYSNQMN